MVNINELKEGDNGLTIQGVVIEKAPVRTFQKYGKPGKVASAVLKDDTGSIILSLWGEYAETIEEGDEITITEAEIKNWQGSLQINPARTGTITKRL